MDKFKVNETLLVGVDFTNGEDVGVILVGRRENGTVKIINAFQGHEAIDIYRRLIDVDKKEG